MLSKEFRLRHSDDFQKVYRRGKYLTTANFVWRYRKRVGKVGVRFGIVVSKKYGNSPIRHRFKRVLRACFKKNCGLWPSGYDIVVQPKKHLKGEFVFLQKVDREVVRALGKIAGGRR